ncbi:hypothetical protein CLHUN_30980 [Ruminiclostridium hungatei]|uniref:PhnB-like domain-containing protein n=1 Tax=Ruminiclostridium hungatei TaxID=48256 RepID=A0A1V4SGN3_RUMHU|nr:VOC family protein [Ruminiclostridium hungatei]OPX42954.1 hypothetical protein CLHUN_30980 [Ruminiclostridium hungatei]
MALQVYINFNGNCREAVEFYAEVFKAEKQKIMLMGDTPANPDFPIPEDAKKLVLHTFLDIKGGTVMFSDVMPGMDFKTGNNISLTVLSDDAEEVRSMFDKLSQGGTVQMELQETFWSKCYGFVIDRFGVGWQLSQRDA